MLELRCLQCQWLWEHVAESDKTMSTKHVSWAFFSVTREIFAHCTPNIETQSFSHTVSVFLLLLFQFLGILNHPASRAIQNGSVKALKDTIMFYDWKELKIPSFLHHDVDPKDICHVALFHAFEWSITATIQLAKCFPFLVSSNAPHCTNPWSVAAEWVSEMLLSVGVVCSSHPIPTVIPGLFWE